MDPNMDFASQQACHADFSLKQNLFRIGDDCICDRFVKLHYLLLFIYLIYLNTYLKNKMLK